MIMPIKKDHLCISISVNGENNCKNNGESTKPFQRSCPLALCNELTSSALHGILPQDERPTDGVLRTTASTLEKAITNRLASRQDSSKPSVSSESHTRDSVEVFVSDDAHLLRCRPLSAVESDDSSGNDCLPPMPHSIFGIVEASKSLNDKPLQSRMNGRNNDVKSDKYNDVVVDLTVLELQSDSNSSGEQTACCCNHPRGHWKRNVSRIGRTPTGTKDENKSGAKVAESSIGATGDINCPASVKFVDLTKMQNFRRRNNNVNEYPCFDSPGKVLHLLRSLLECECGHSQVEVLGDNVNIRGGLHCASPWKHGYVGGESSIERKQTTIPLRKAGTDSVVSLLVNIPEFPSDDESRGDSIDVFWSDIEERELNELLKFRTGDAAPSYFLYSTSELVANDSVSSDVHDELLGGRSASGKVGLNSVMLLNYRHLPPRDVISHGNPSYATNDLVPSHNFVGCQWETYLEDPPETELDILMGISVNPKPVVKHRMVAPPYQSYGEEYPGILDSFLEKIDVIRGEAMRIPQWTAWPEKNHYSSDENEGDEEGNPTYPASWTVFPLCHTFPADDVTQRKFIERTCAFVPQTTKLLKELGPVLRTALFSRLERRTTLGTHTGWSDLANHVLRVHIPLIVPGGKIGGCSYNEGLCGTWVDGCVETHDEGRIICFDDSKVHRAFNYSDDERVVLIVDLERNTTQLPIGNATGGHTEELDSFIKQLT